MENFSVKVNSNEFVKMLRGLAPHRTQKETEVFVRSLAGRGPNPKYVFNPTPELASQFYSALVGNKNLSKGEILDRVETADHIKRRFHVDTARRYLNDLVKKGYATRKEKDGEAVYRRAKKITS